MGEVGTALEYGHWNTPVSIQITTYIGSICFDCILQNYHNISNSELNKRLGVNCYQSLFLETFLLCSYQN